jgi:hypothetical protein
MIVANVNMAACLTALSMLAAWAANAEAAAKLRQWQTIESERHGFVIAYPGSVFAPREGATSNGTTSEGTTNDGTTNDEGHVLVSHDGGARLLVAAFANDAEATLAEYRAQLLAENYHDADIDYAPVKKRFFVLSGTRGDMHFYERASFTCGGALINSWALLYPVSERKTYDRIVEAIARTYSPGAGRDGQCD